MAREWAIIAAVIALALYGCDPVDSPWETDQELRREIFFQCLQALPKGPESTRYNDWSEVVEECGDQAYHMAQKRKDGR